MPHLRINNQVIHYEKDKRYLSIGVVGSTHGGAVYGLYGFDPKRRLGYQQRKQLGESLEWELTHELSLIDKFLRSRVYHINNGVRELTEEDKPHFENTQRLYLEILSVLKGG